MRNGPRLDVWLVGLLVGVCLTGAAYAIFRFNVGGIRNSSLQTLSALPATPSLAPVISGRREAKIPRPHSSRHSSQSAHATTIFPQMISGDSSQIENQGAQPVETAVPARQILKPLGYVQKANGSVEAIVGDGDGVQVVHVGDIYQDHYTVAQISSDAVEIVAASAPSHQTENTPVEIATAAPNLPRPLGYVERADGTRINVVPDGKFVRLEPQGETLASKAPVQRVPDAVLSAKISKPIAPRQNPADLNHSNPRTAPANPVVATARILKAPSAISLRPQTLTAAMPFQAQGNNGNPSKALGYVEKADGTVQAIFDGGSGVRLSQMAEAQKEPLMASVGPETEWATQAAGTLVARTEPQAVPIAKSDPQNGTPSPMLPQLWEPPNKPPPEQAVALAEDGVIPEKPPPEDGMVATALGLEAEAASSSDREATVLRSLGYLNTQDGRASPEPTRFDPAAPPKGPPASDTNVLMSFGYADWQYGRASSLAPSLRIRTGASDASEPKTAILKSIGYLEWPDGHSLAVIDDGGGGVRLVGEGETLDGRFRVVKIGPDAVEIVELPGKQSSLAPPSHIGFEGPPQYDAAESRSGATSIAELPVRRASLLPALAMADLAQPTSATSAGRVGKAAEPRTRSSGLGTFHSTKVPKFPVPSKGKVGAQHQESETTSVTLAQPMDDGALTHRETSQAHPSQALPRLLSQDLRTSPTDWPRRIP